MESHPIDPSGSWRLGHSSNEEEVNAVAAFWTYRNPTEQDTGIPGFNVTRELDYMPYQENPGSTWQNNELQIAPEATAQAISPRTDIDQPWDPTRLFGGFDASTSVANYTLSSAVGRSADAFLDPQASAMPIPPSAPPIRTGPPDYSVRDQQRQFDVLHPGPSGVQSSNWCPNPLAGSVSTDGSIEILTKDFPYQVSNATSQIPRFGLDGTGPTFTNGMTFPLIPPGSTNGYIPSTRATASNPITAVPNHIPSTDGQLIFHQKSGKPLRPLTGRRKATKEEKTHSRNIRHSGGACDRCKKAKKRCQPWHRLPADGPRGLEALVFDALENDQANSVDLPEELEPFDDSIPRTAMDTSSLIPSLGMGSSFSTHTYMQEGLDEQPAAGTIRRSPHTFQNYNPGMGGQFAGAK